MNSSGIKRGLASTAVAALAVTGLPFLASSASAAATDISALQLGSVGPVRDGGNQGGVVVLKVKEGSTSITPANFLLSRTDDRTQDADIPGKQDITRVGNSAVIDENDPADSTPGDGFDEVHLNVGVLTAKAGNSYAYSVYYDANVDGDYDLGEPVVDVTGTTVGDPVGFSISPSSQTTAEGTPSGKYTVALVDSSNRPTQLNTGETIGLTDTTSPVPASLTSFAPDATIDSDDAEQGSATFTASNVNAGTYQITATGAGGVVAEKTATARLTVVTSANITADEVDIQSGADSWDGPGGGDFGAPATQVRRDQGSVTIDIQSSDPDAEKGSTVVLTASRATGTATFDGKTSKTYTAVLDPQGHASITITPDAGSITDGTSIALSGAFTETLEFVAPKIDAANGTIRVPATYVSAYGGSVDVTATVLDQFGQPAVGALVDAQRTGGANADATPTAKKAVDENGQVTFTFTDTKATAASHATDTVTLRVYPSRFDATYTKSATTKIEYTATGQGNDFGLTFDNTPTEGGTYDPATVSINPLTDAQVDNSAGGDSTDEYVALGIVGATAGAPLTVSADNGALVLKDSSAPFAPATNGLTAGAASQSGTDADQFYIVGTKAGLVTVTVESAGVTKTAQFTVKPAAAAVAATTARNVEVSAPEKANSGGIATFTVKVTDAFGNGVAGVNTMFSMNFQVSGPGRVQDQDAVSDANGEIKVNVRLDDDASSPVTLRATGLPVAVGGANQFGAAANQHTAASTSADAPGLTASVQAASATLSDVTNMAELQAAVDEAQAEVNKAQAALEKAQGRVKVAKAEKKVAKRHVKQAKKALKKAKKRHAGVPAAKRNLRQAKGDLKVANVKVKATKNVRKNRKALLKDAQAELAAAEKALEDAQNEG